jgi:hypothetical protein
MNSYCKAVYQSRDCTKAQTQTAVGGVPLNLHRSSTRDFAENGATVSPEL